MTQPTDIDRPVALIILDGWGLAPPGPGNAVAAAKTPNFDALWESVPRTELTASGESVGLPPGQIGNSEVGHLNLGAGRIVPQDLMRINAAVEHGELRAHAVLQDAIDAVRARSGRVHILGLASTGGVHSHVEHIIGLAEAVAAIGAGEVECVVHAFTDGRDVAPTASLVDIPALEARLDDCGARIASVIGRYWAMDRDQRWERTQRAWDLLVEGVGTPVESPVDAVGASHDDGITDEFMEPFVIVDGGFQLPRIATGDLVIHANFRPDRTRQLCHSLVDIDFDGFARTDPPAPALVTMTHYDDTLGVPILFGEQQLHDTLADVLEAAGIGQLHVAETEKYAHVTYFFNGGVETEHDGEARALVPSPRDVPTYDHKPQMSAAAAADAFVDGFSNSEVGFGIINFANPDMVGHTGVIPAAIAAVEEVDQQLGRVLAAVAERGGAAVITADHGNAEQMLTGDGTAHTAHTTNPVPLMVVGGPGGLKLRAGGILADVAPTVLSLMGIDQPAAMTGLSLVEYQTV